MALKKHCLPANMHYNHKVLIRILIQINGRMRIKYASKPVSSNQPPSKMK